GIGDDGIDYSGQEVWLRSVKAAHGSGSAWTPDPVLIPGAPDPDPDPDPGPGPADRHPLADRVAEFLGLPGDPDVVAMASQQATVITEMARAYTRDAGFNGPDPNSQIAAVIVAATARLVGNPEQIAHGIGDVQYRGGFSGWSLAETTVLNRYRKRAR
ncbi:MAG: hypothetical protein WBA05_09120, partial [Gordonia sp. (in: high G+C Gram-positive bacteria)]